MQCQTAKDPYIDSNPSQGPIVVNIPMDLLCIDFMTLSTSKAEKENILVIADIFQKFSVAIITPNQQAKTEVKA